MAEIETKLEQSEVVSVKDEYEKTQIGRIIQNLESDLVGLKPVKKRIREIAALLLIDKLRQNIGLNSGNPGLHMSFTGSPGTGKTTALLRLIQDAITAGVEPDQIGFFSFTNKGKAILAKLHTAVSLSSEYKITSQQRLLLLIVPRFF